MHASHKRLSLARLGRRANGSLVVDGPVPLNEYSRFKYGDGLVAADYGERLATAWLERACTGAPVLLTGPGFGAIKPAAHALLPSMADTLRRAGLEVTTFTVHRSTVSNGDYATMSAEQRAQALNSDSLTCHGVKLSAPGTVVIAVDDVRVTGTHEWAMDQCLRTSGANDIAHLYILDAFDVRGDPRTESAINAAAVRGVDDLLAMASLPVFVPNARYCRAVVTLRAAHRRRFLREAPVSVVDWLRDAIIADGLRDVPAYAQRATVLLDEAAHLTPAA